MLERLALLRADLEGFRAASERDNADDEHDPEGATIAFERSQVAALLREGERRLRRPRRRAGARGGRHVRRVRAVRPPDPGRPARGPPRGPHLRRLRLSPSLARRGGHRAGKGGA